MAMALDYFTGTRALFAVDDAQRDAPVEVVLDCGVVEVFGRVVDPTGGGLGGAEIEFRIQDGAGASYTLTAMTHTHVQGYYTAWLPSRDGFTLESRVVKHDGEALSEWAPAASLASDSHYQELPELHLSTDSVAYLASRPEPEALRTCRNPGHRMDMPLQSLGGTIQDPEGKPIAGAKILLQDYDSGQANARTDEHGHWARLVPGEWKYAAMEVWHPDFVPSRLSPQHENPSQARIRDGSSVFVLERGTAVAGIVRDGRGRPVGDAVIGLVVGSVAGKVRTGADGRFTTPAMPTGSWPVTLSHPAYAASFASLQVPPPPPVVQLDLDEGGTVAGRVIDEDGTPVTGMRVAANELYPDTFSSSGPVRVSVQIGTVTDEDGEFRLDRIPTHGKTRFTVEAPRDDNTGLGEAYLPINTFRLVPREAAYTITLHRPPHVDGVVMDDKTGAPVEQFTLENRKVEPNDRPVIGYITSFPKDTVVESDTEGRFSRDVGEGYVDLVPDVDLVLDVRAEGYFPAVSPVFHPGQAAPPMVIRLVRAEAFAGVVLDAAGTPRGGVQVAWAGDDHRVTVEGDSIRAIREKRKIETSDEAGRFSVMPLAPGGQLLAACDGGYAVADCVGFGREGPLRLQPWSTVRGTLYRGAAPWPDTLVDMRGAGSGDGAVPPAIIWGYRETTHVDGTFTFKFVPALPMELGRKVSVQARQELWPGVALTPSPGETVEVALGTGAGAVTGQAILPDDLSSALVWKPENVRVELARIDVPSPAGMPAVVGGLGEDGVYLIEGLEPGRYRVTASLYGDDVTYPSGLGTVRATGTAVVEIVDGVVEAMPIVLEE